MELTVTKELMETATGGKSIFSQAQIEMAKGFCQGKSPMRKLIGKTVSTEWWDQFIANRFTLSKSAQKKQDKRQKKKEQLAKLPKILNPMTRSTGSWEWKPLESDVPRIKVASSENGKNQGKKSTKRSRVSRSSDKEFYLSPQWRNLRVRVLSKYDCKCMMCGRSPKAHGIVIHVDHIKSRSKYPDLALCFENLQLLCEDCNIGKSNRYEVDYRPDTMPELDWDLLENMPTNMQ